MCNKTHKYYMCIYVCSYIKIWQRKEEVLVWLTKYGYNDESVTLSCRSTQLYYYFGSVKWRKKIRFRRNDR